VIITKFKRPILIHGLAFCSVCDWQNSSSSPFRNAVKEARSHTNKTGHKTVVETGYSQTYVKEK